MEIKYIIIVAISVCVIALILFLIIRNEKDKDEVMKFFNETEVEEEIKSDDELKSVDKKEE